MEAETVLARRQGRIGRITLNRTKALNALDHGMVLAVGAALRAWDSDPAVHAVVIEGAGGRAFCAGGDVRVLRGLVVDRSWNAIEAFFVDEYAVNLQLSRYSKPVVSIIDGLCMGGGIGLSVHGSVRVVTDAAVMAMPETGIGLFPDVGATFILPRLRRGYGMYMALTGARATGGDAVYVGLATHYVGRDRVADLADAVAEDGIAALANAVLPAPPGPLATIVEPVRCFDQDSVAAIIATLEASPPGWPPGWALETLGTLRTVSPSAVMWTFEAVCRGALLTLEQCLAAELALTRHVTRHPDFAEGVRAMVVDKDRNPRWSPPRLEDVSADDIAAMFER